MTTNTIPTELWDAIRIWLKETFDWAEVEETTDGVAGSGLNICVKTGLPNPAGSKTDIILTFSPSASCIKIECPYGGTEAWQFYPDDKAGGLRLTLGSRSNHKECGIFDPNFFFDVLTAIIQTSMLITMGRVQPAYYKERIHESQWAKDLREYMSEMEEDG